MTGFESDTLGDYIIKDPDADLDYAMDWSAWLDGDTINAATWTVGAGLTKHDEAVSGDITTVWLKGGNAGQTYWVSCRIVTANVIPRTEDRSFRVMVRQR